MSYVEYCKEHGQYHGEHCGECVEATQDEVIDLQRQLATQTERTSTEIGHTAHWMSKYADSQQENVRLREALERFGNADGEVAYKIRRFLEREEARQDKYAPGSDWHKEAEENGQRAMDTRCSKAKDGIHYWGQNDNETIYTCVYCSETRTTPHYSSCGWEAMANKGATTNREWASAAHSAEKDEE